MFTTFQVNNRDKFLKKKQEKKEKIVEKSQTKNAIVKVQKNLRAFIYKTRQFHQNKNNRYGSLFCTKRHLFEYNNQLQSFWNSDLQIYPGSSLITKKIVFLTLQYLNSSKQQGKFEYKKLLNTIINQKINFNGKQQVAASNNLVKLYIENRFSDNVLTFFASSSILFRKIMDYAKKHPSLLIRLAKQAESWNQLKWILQQHYLIDQNLQVIQTDDRQGLLQLYYKIKQQFLKKNSKELNGFLIHYLNIVMQSLIYNVQLLIIDRYNYKRIYLKEYEQQFMETVQQQQQWQVLVACFQFQDYDLNIMLQNIGTAKKDMINFIVRLLKYKYAKVGLSLSLTFTKSIINNLLNLQVYQMQANEQMQKQFLLYLSLLQKLIFSMSDRSFTYLFKGQTQLIEKLVKGNLVKLVNAILFAKKAITTDIKTMLKFAVNILENLYNKIFRTKIVSSQIFQNKALLSNFLKFNYKNNILEDVGQFLKKFPFIFPMQARVSKFREFVRQDSYNYRHMAYEMDQDMHGGQVAIRRGYEFQDAFNSLQNRNMKKRFQISFINQYGMHQKGIDAGGLSKEFLNRVLKTVLNPIYGMFIQNHKKELMPHPLKAQIKQGKICQQYQFIGKLLGKALYDGVNIAPKFSGPFLNVLVGKKNHFQDLREVDLDLYNSLNYILTMEEDASQLCLTFQYKDDNRKKLINLKHQGSKIKVTNQNKFQYVNLLSDYKVNRLIEFQSRSIRRGLSKIINQQWLHMFNYQQLNYMISGSGTVNVLDLKMHTKLYGYKEGDKTIRFFWKILQEMEEEDKSNLLMFVTACPRVSLLGFRDLSPPFTIKKGQDSNLLPTAHTCSNVLVLPEYKTQSETKEKLLIAIRSNSGFQFA